MLALVGTAGLFSAGIEGVGLAGRIVLSAIGSVGLTGFAIGVAILDVRDLRCRMNKRGNSS